MRYEQDICYELIRAAISIIYRACLPSTKILPSSSIQPATNTSSGIFHDHLSVRDCHHAVSLSLPVLLLVPYIPFLGTSIERLVF